MRKLFAAAFAALCLALGLAVPASAVPAAPAAAAAPAGVLRHWRVTGTAHPGGHDTVVAYDWHSHSTSRYRKTAPDALRWDGVVNIKRLVVRYYPNGLGHKSVKLVDQTYACSDGTENCDRTSGSIIYPETASRTLKKSAAIRFKLYPVKGKASTKTLKLKDGYGTDAQA